MVLEDRTVLAAMPISPPFADHVTNPNLNPIIGDDFATVASLTDGTIAVSSSSDMSTQIEPVAGLGVYMTDSPDPVPVGTNLTYNLVAYNHGLLNSLFTAWSMTLPAGTTFVSATGPSDWILTTPAVGATGQVFGTNPGLFFAGDEPLFTIVVNVDPATPVGTTISAEASISPTSIDDDRSDNIARTTTTTVALPQSDVAVTMTDTPDPVAAGANLTYNVDVASYGPLDAQLTTLVDTLPAGTTFVSATGPSDWILTTPAVGATGQVSAYNPSLFFGGRHAFFTIVVKVDPAAPVGTTISNMVYVATGTPEFNLSDNSATRTTMVAVSADLAIAMTDTPDPVNAGSDITYTLTVTNNGPSDAQSYLVSDSVQSSGMGIVSFSHLTGPPAGGVLPAGATATFQVVVTVDGNVPAGTMLVNSASVGSSTPDPDPANNSTTATTTVATSADLAVTMTDTPDPVIAGTNLTYTIALSSNGPRDAQNVGLNDLIPLGTTFVSATAPAGWSTMSPAVGGTGTVTFTRSSFDAGASSTFTIVVFVSASVPDVTTITNSATVTSTTPDSNPTNNTGTAITTVNASANLAVTKSANPSPVTLGSTITYTIPLTSNGPSVAQNVSVTDGIPAGTTFVSATAPAGWTTTAPAVGGNGTVSFARATFAVGGSATFTIVVQVSTTFPTTATVSNTVNVSSSTSDPNTENNSFTTNTPVSSDVDVVVTKTASPNPVLPGANLTYTVTVRNAGSAAAANVTLYELLPDQSRFVSNSGAPGWTSSNPPVGSTGGIITSTTPGLAPGATANFIIIVSVPATIRPGTILLDRAVATTSSTEQNRNNNAVESRVTVGQAVVAAVAKTSSSARAKPAATSKAITDTVLTAVQVRDQVLATSGGLVNDVIRKKILAGLFGTGG